MERTEEEEETEESVQSLLSFLIKPTNAYSSSNRNENPSYDPLAVYNLETFDRICHISIVFVEPQQRFDIYHQHPHTSLF